jgi:hypothetical protein
VKKQHNCRSTIGLYLLAAGETKQPVSICFTANHHQRGMIGASIKSSRHARIWEGRRLVLARRATIAAGETTIAASEPTIAAGETGRGQAIAPPIFAFANDYQRSCTSERMF